MESEETGGTGQRGGGECLSRCRPEFASGATRLALDARDAVSIGEAVRRVLERIEAHLGSASDKQVGLPLRVVDALAGDVEILGFALNPDEVAVFEHTGNTSAARPHKGIKTSSARRDYSFNDLPHEREPLLSRVIDFLVSPDSCSIGVRIKHIPALGICVIEWSTRPIAIKSELKAARPPIPRHRWRRASLYPAGRLDREALLKRKLKKADLRSPTENKEGFCQLASHKHGFNSLIANTFAVPCELQSALPIKLVLSAEIVANCIRWIGNDSINLTERRQHFPAITEIQRGASNGFNAGHSERPHSISPGLRQAEDDFTRSAGFDCPVELCFQLAGRVQAWTCDDHRMTHGQFGKSALAFGEAGEAHHRLVSAQWRIQRPMQQPRASAIVGHAMISVIGSMLPPPELQAALGVSAVRSTPCFFASLVIASTRQLGIFDPFQLDTVDGVSFSARATATVPPSASMMSAAFCMAHCYDNRNTDASG